MDCLLPCVLTAEVFARFAVWSAPRRPCLGAMNATTVLREHSYCKTRSARILRYVLPWGVPTREDQAAATASSCS